MNNSEQPYEVVRVHRPDWTDITPTVKVNTGNSFEQACDLARLDALALREEQRIQQVDHWNIVNAVTHVNLHTITP